MMQKTAIQLTDLDQKSLKMLCYFAYYGEDGKGNATDEFKRWYKLSDKSFENCREKLQQNGFIKSGTLVTARWHIKVLCCLYGQHSEWIAVFRGIYSYCRSSLAEYLCYLVELVLEDNYEEALKLSRPHASLSGKNFNLLEYLQLDTEEDRKFLKLIKTDEIHETLEKLFVNDELTNEMLSSFENVAIETQNQLLQTEVAAYQYFLNGNTMPSFPVHTFWTRVVEGIDNLYKGKIYESVDSFAQALKLSGERAHAFKYPLLNYFYGIALYKESKMSDNGDKFKNFVSDRTVRLDNDHFAIRMLFNGIDADEQENKQRLSNINISLDKPLCNTFICLIYHFFGVEKPHGLEDAKLHSASILQHETAIFQLLDTARQSELRNIYGGAPLLSTIRRVSAWEKALKDLSLLAEQQTEVKKRIVYYVSGLSLVSVMEQKMIKGEWQDNVLLSVRDMAKKGYDSMDEVDTNIAMRLRSKMPGETDVDVLVPLLKNTDRLFSGSYYNSHHSPVIIDEEDPKLSFVGKDDCIEIQSNVLRDEEGNIKRNSVSCIASGYYKLVSINPLQKDLMNRLLSVGKLPVSAVYSLQNAVNKIKGMIDVDDACLASLAQPAMPSLGILAVRVSPEKLDYHIRIKAMGKEGGHGRYTPGEGEELVYDETDGILTPVKRDLTKEYAHYKQLHDYIIDELNAEFDTQTELTLGMAESLLKLMAYVHEYPDRYVMEWPDGRPLKLRGSVTASNIDVQIKSNINWFAVQGTVTLEGVQLSLQELVDRCSKAGDGEFVKIGEDEYVRISDKLKKHLAAMAALQKKDGKTCKISKFQMGALASMIEGLHVNVDKGYDEFMKKTKDAYALNPDAPAELTAQLRDYQMEGFRWLCRLSAWGAGACLADDMGLGKTLQSIAFMLYKANEGASLVIVPKSVLPNWENELAKFAPTLKVYNLNNENDRAKTIEKAGAKDILLCTYGVLGTETDSLAAKSWNVVCLDEAHQIKNRNTNASRAVMKLVAHDRLMLTGTPLQNNLGELWNLFQFINPGLLGSWSQFRDSFTLDELDNDHKALLKEMTMPFILRRTKEEVLDELPEKIINECMVELTPDETRVYEEMRRLIELKFKKNKSKSERKESKELDMNFFAELTKLRMAACAMRLVHEHWEAQSSKIVALMDILDSVLANPDNNVIVFSQFTSFLDLIKTELKTKKYDYLYLDGQTPLDKRQEYVKNFQNGQCKLFLSSLKAGGLGINLTAANYVILLDPWWNPAIENQAMDRAHRIGQERIVTVIRMISAHTIEEKIMSLHAKKQNISDDILEGTADSSKLTYEEILDMVTPF